MHLQMSVGAATYMLLWSPLFNTSKNTLSAHDLSLQSKALVPLLVLSLPAAVNQTQTCPSSQLRWFPLNNKKLLTIQLKYIYKIYKKIYKKTKMFQKFSWTLKCIYICTFPALIQYNKTLFVSRLKNQEKEICTESLRTNNSFKLIHILKLLL